MRKVEQQVIARAWFALIVALWSYVFLPLAGSFFAIHSVSAQAQSALVTKPATPSSQGVLTIPGLSSNLPDLQGRTDGKTQKSSSSSSSSSSTSAASPSATAPAPRGVPGSVATDAEKASGDAASTLAGHAMTAGSMISSGVNGRQAADMAQDQLRGMASSAATAEVERWLSGVGNARINVNADRNLSLKNSSADLLVPWYDNQDYLFFSQHALHRTDDRTQLNTGLGARYFSPGLGYMVGANAFLDYDLTRYHSRFGLGVEYGQDFLKLGANGYFRLSGWRDAPELNNDYEARPANGWDVRTEGWLPAYPQLGASLKVEQYYGKEVALFSANKRQHNPMAVTAGVNWTPFPLLTANAEHARGSGGQNDNKIGLQVNLVPGLSWAQHLDPDAVSGRRTLTGSRLDLVERNNNIILEYRKKELITLALFPLIEGMSGSTWPLVKGVTSKYPLKNIVWDMTEFLQFGGKISGSGTSTQITLPPYRQSSDPQQTKALNTWRIAGVAYDTQGNASPLSLSEVVVTGGGISIVSLTSTAGAAADGTATNTLTAVVQDDNGVPVSGQTVTFTLPTGISPVGVSAKTSQFPVVTDDAGLAKLNVTSLVVGQFIVSAALSTGSAVNGMTEFLPDTTTARISHLAVVTNNVIADGVSAAGVKATVMDSQGNPVPDAVVSFTADNGATIAGSGITDARGEVSMPLTSLVAGNTNVTAVLNGSSQTVMVTFVADTATAQVATLVVTRDNAAANGAATNGVMATVTSVAGTPLAGQTVTFTADGGATIAGTGTTNAQGEASVSLTSLTAGVSNVTASINGSLKAVAVTFVPDTTMAQLSEFVVVADNAAANGAATNSVKATVTDAQGNPLAGQTVTFTADGGATIAGTGTTNALGEVLMTLTSLVVASSNVTAGINGFTMSVVVHFTPDAATAQVVSLDVISNGAAADGMATNSVRATVKDAQGNLVSNAAVGFGADNGATIGGTGTTGSNGTVVMTLTSTVAGSSTVTASLSGSTKTAVVTFGADSSTAQVATLAVVTDNAAANGTAQNSVKATVTDAQGNPVSGMTVGFTADGGATIAPSGTTNAQGEVTVSLTSLTTGVSHVTAGLNGSVKSVDVTFTPDVATAQIASLVVVDDNSKANGTDANSVLATVTDAQGHPLAGQTVTFTAGNGATLASVSGTTDARGEVLMPLTSLVAGGSLVTASLNGSTKSALVTFIADITTAQVVTLVTVDDNATANGLDRNSVRATVKDANGNLVSGATVNFQADSRASIAGTGTTDGSGEVLMTLTSTTAGISTVTASLYGSSKTTPVTFTPDTSTAEVASLVVVDNDAVADGVATNSVRATITDRQGNPLTGETVTFTAGNGALISGSGTTDSSGQILMPLTNTTAGDSQVAASLNGSQKTATVSFVADASTARISTLVMTVNNAIVGLPDTVQATVVDAHNNALENQDVLFTVDNGATIGTAVTTRPGICGTVASGGITDANGQASLLVCSAVAGSKTVTASINGSTKTVQAVFVVDTATARISSLVVTSNGATADGSTTNSVMATVTDALGNPLSGQSVAFAASNGASVAAPSGTTATDGTVSMTLTSLVDGDSTVTAGPLNGSTKTATVTFVSDTSTARISDLVVVTNDALANGTATNSVRATVTSAGGSPLAGEAVTFTAGAGTTVIGSGVTDANGEATVQLTSLTAGSSNVTAGINGTTASVSVTFIADASTAQLIELTAVTDNALANNAATNSVLATVVDANNNPLSGLAVSFTADHATIAPTGQTTANGTVLMTLTSSTAGASNVTATLDLNGSSKSVVSTFIPDTGTAAVDSLTVVDDHAVADGVVQNRVLATVKDARGNLIPNMTVTFTATGPASIATTATTDAAGQVLMPLTSTASGNVTVSAKVGTTAAKTVVVTFDVDTNSAAVTAMTVVTNNAVANGTATNSVKVTVKNAAGTLLPGMTVTFTADNGATIAGSGVTLADGTVTMTLTSLTAGVSNVTAAINASTMSAAVTFTPDASTQRISDLVVVTDNALATGLAADVNSVKATVTDASGNPVNGATVSFTADNSSTITATGKTGADGTVTQTLTSKLAGVKTVTASITGTASGPSSMSKTVTFVANPGTAQVTTLEVVDNNAVANGTAQNTVLATVTDVNNNVLPGLDVTFSATNSATVAATGTTDASGQVRMPVVSTLAGNSVITASINGKSKTATVMFIADMATARVTSLTVETDNQLADGVKTNVVKATVQDVYGNLVPGAVVDFTTDPSTDGLGVMFTTGSAPGTGASQGTTLATPAASLGTVTMSLTSKTEGQNNVFATLNNQTENAVVTFGFYAGAYVITPTWLTQGAAPNGDDVNILEVSVTRWGIPVPGAVVTLPGTDNIWSPDTATTDANGVAQIDVYAALPLVTTGGNATGSMTLTAAHAVVVNVPGVATPLQQIPTLGVWSIRTAGSTTDVFADMCVNGNGAAHVPVQVDYTVKNGRDELIRSNIWYAISAYDRAPSAGWKLTVTDLATGNSYVMPQSTSTASGTIIQSTSGGTISLQYAVTGANCVAAGAYYAPTPGMRSGGNWTGGVWFQFKTKSTAGAWRDPTRTVGSCGGAGQLTGSFGLSSTCTAYGYGTRIGTSIR